MKFGGLPYEMHRLGGRNEVRSSPPWRRGDKEAREGGGGAIYFKVLISLKHKSSGNNYVEQLYEVITCFPCPGRAGQRGGDEDLPRVALPPLQLHQPQSEGEPQGAHPQQVRHNTGQQLLSVYNFHMTLCVGTPTLVNHLAACSAVNICPAEAVSRCTYHRSIARNRR